MFEDEIYIYEDEDGWLTIQLPPNDAEELYCLLGSVPVIIKPTQNLFDAMYKVYNRVGDWALITQITQQLKAWH